MVVLMIGLALVSWRLVESINEKKENKDVQSVIVGEIFGVVLLGLICCMLGFYILNEYFFSVSIEITDIICNAYHLKEVHHQT